MYGGLRGFWGIGGLRQIWLSIFLWYIDDNYIGSRGIQLLIKSDLSQL